MIRRIFAEYVAGVGPPEIARRLNDDGIPSATGKKWSASTILGHRQRRTGILCNEIYSGRLVWNVVSYSRDPDTGKRRESFNPESAWQTADIPELRIIDQKTWEAAQALRNRRVLRPEQARRPKRLLSGLVRCSRCDGPMIVVDKGHFGCAAYRSSRSCENGRKLAIDRLERTVLDSLKDTLLKDDHFAAFASEYHHAYQRYQKDQRKQAKAISSEIRSLDKKIERLVAAITEGTDTPSMRKTLVELEARRAKAVQVQSGAEEEREAVALLPNLPDTFRRQVERLEATIKAEPAIRDAAATSLRTLIDSIVARPTEKRGSWSIEILTRPGALLALSTNREQSPDWLITMASPGGLEPPFTA